MNITSALYSVVIHKYTYTQCYTSVILGVVLLLLYTPYCVPICNAILKRITCV